MFKRGFAAIATVALLAAGIVMPTSAAQAAPAVRMAAHEVDGLRGQLARTQTAKAVWMRQATALTGVGVIEPDTVAVGDAFRAREAARMAGDAEAVVTTEATYLAAKEQLREANAAVASSRLTARTAGSKRVPVKNRVFTATNLPAGSTWTVAKTRDGAALGPAGRVIGAVGDPVALRGELDGEVEGTVHLAWTHARGLWNDGTDVGYRVLAIPFDGFGVTIDELVAPGTYGVDASVDLEGLDETEDGYKIAVQARNSVSESLVLVKTIARLADLRGIGLFELGQLPNTAAAGSGDDGSSTTGGGGGGASGGGGGGGGGAVQLEPSAPLNVVATAAVGQVTLTWQPPASPGISIIQGYRVQQSDDNGATWATANASPDPTLSTQLTTTVSGLAASTTFKYRVIAFNAAGDSVPSVVASATTPAIPAPSEPLNLVAAASSTPFVVELDWDEPATDNGFAITEYRLQKRAAGASTWDTLTPVVATTASITVSTITAYEFRVAAFNGTVSAWATSSAVTPIPNPPTVVRNVTATASTTAFEIDLSWTAPASNGGTAITEYRIEQTTGGGSWTALTGPFIATHATITTPSPVAAHTFRVAAFNGTSQGPWVEVGPVTANPDAPSVVQNLTATASTTTPFVVELDWDAPASDGGAAITEYRLQKRAAGAGTWDTLTPVVATSSTITVSTITAYEFRVAAFNGTTASAWVTAGPVTPMPAAPSAVRTLTAAASSTPFDITLTWQAPLDNGGVAIQQYVIEQSRGGGTWTAVTGPFVATTATITTPSPVAAHTFRVAAFNGTSQGQWATSASVTPIPNPPTVAQNLVATASVTPFTIELDWDAPSSDGGASITEYRIEKRASGASTWDAVTTTAGTSAAITVSTITAYEFRVAAFNGTSQGQWATSASVTPIPNAPSAPLSVTATTSATTPFVVDLTWSAPTDNGGAAVTQYYVQQSVGGGAWAPLTGPFAAPPLSITTSSIASHTWRVAAVNTGGQGPWATSNTVNPVPGTPGAPTGATATATSGTPWAITVSWTAPTANGGSPITEYRLQQRAVGSSSWDAVPGTVAGTSTQLTFTQLVQYEFQVQASNSVWSAWSGTSNAATPTSPYNDATGGTITTFVSDGTQPGTIAGHRYRVHSFAASATLTVASAVAPFDVLVAGGGGGHGAGAADRGPGGGGGGGVVERHGLTLAEGGLDVVVGATAAYVAGGASSFAGIIAGGGGRGADGNTGGNKPSGGTSGTPQSNPGGLNSADSWTGGWGGSAGVVSAITGSPVEYGKGGVGGLGYPPRGMANGAAGGVIVRYEVAP